MIVAALAAIALAFLLLFATRSPATMLIGIGIGITTIYIAVPAILLKIESAHSGRISFAEFFEKGLRTLTGHLPARPAMAQVPIAPLAIALAAAFIGIVARLPF